MLKSMFVFLSLVFTLSAFAAEIPVMEVTARYYNDIDTKIKVNIAAGEGSVQLKLYRQTFRPRGGSTRMLVLSKEAKVDGLFLQGDKLIYRGEEADVDCGTMGVSRVFKIPTLFLTGHCDVKVVENGRNLKVFFVTK